MLTFLRQTTLRVAGVGLTWLYTPVPDQQGHGYLTLSRELHRGLHAGGYRSLRSTFVERDNPAAAAQYRRAGGRPLHGHTFYERTS